MAESAEVALTARLKGEIARLFEISSLIYDQMKATERAVYLGMTPDEVKQTEARGKKIKSLLAEVISSRKA